MPGAVLRRHGIVSYDKSRRAYSLESFDQLRQEEVAELIRACDEELHTYLERRGDSIWDHRRKSAGYISGNLTFEILKAAKYRCELCGTPVDERAIQVDHILPRNKGGSDDPSNLQALCYRCNASKRARDDTDFRAIRALLHRREAGCPFCVLPTGRIVAANELAVAVRDLYPVAPLHTLVMPRRHDPDYFQLAEAEIRACGQILREQQSAIRQVDPKVEAFNIGVNTGAAAGQSVPHCHIHLIPRRLGDVDEPRGGVHNVFPGKGSY